MIIWGRSFSSSDFSNESPLSIQRTKEVICVYSACTCTRLVSLSTVSIVGPANES